jgi:hypothetical protein
MVIFTHRSLYSRGVNLLPSRQGAVWAPEPVCKGKFLYCRRESNLDFPVIPTHILIIIDIVFEHLKVVQSTIRRARGIDFGSRKYNLYIAC